MFPDISSLRNTYSGVHTTPTPYGNFMPTIVQTPLTPDDGGFDFDDADLLSKFNNMSVQAPIHSTSFATTPTPSYSNATPSYSNATPSYSNATPYSNNNCHSSSYSQNYNSFPTINHSHHSNNHHNSQSYHNGGHHHNNGHHNIGHHNDQRPQQRSQNRGGQGRYNNNQPNSNICKFFLQGNCTKGSNCNWTHLVPTVGMGYMSHQNNNSRQPKPRYQTIEPRQTQETAYLNQIKSATELRGEILRLSRQQVGCRLLQKLLEQDETSRSIILEETFESLNTLSSDPFGHHLVLRLLDYVSPAERKRILIQLHDDLVAISLNVHGTRVVQKLLECMDEPDEFTIISEAFETFVITLAKDIYGMHVVLRCLHRIPALDNDHPQNTPNNHFIFNQIISNIVSVATHKHGCCVVQWCIDYANPEQRDALVKVIVLNALELAQDAFGNYVLQQIMDTATEETLLLLTKRLKGSMSKLAVQKFSSIVVEKCIEMSPKERRREVIDEIIDPAKLNRLLQDPYANYVIQKILQITRRDEFHSIVYLIRPHLEILGTTPFGKRIKTQMIRKFPILSMSPRPHDAEPPKNPGVVV